MTQMKKFVPCIYLSGGYAVKSQRDTTIIETDPVRLARSYGDSIAGELFIEDLTGEEEHLTVIRQICTAVGMEVTAICNVHRLEDVKKLLYAGCVRVAMKMGMTPDRTLIGEVSRRFGKDKLMLALQDISTLTEYGNSLQEDVSALFLCHPHLIRNLQDLKEGAAVLPFYVQAGELALNKLIEILSLPEVQGITGNIVNDNLSQLPALCALCRESGIVTDAFLPKMEWNALRKNREGLLPVVVQDVQTEEVLMVAYMNEEAYNTTLQTGKMTYFSRSRKQLWVKGATSGHYQYVKSLTADCDQDTLLARVRQVGAACHTGARSCFFQEVASAEIKEEKSENPLQIFEEVSSVIHDRRVHPKEGSYTNYLFDKGLDKILKKMGEEATEIVIAAKNPDSHEVVYEISDFLYHMMVLMEEKGISWEEVTAELSKR